MLYGRNKDQLSILYFQQSQQLQYFLLKHKQMIEDQTFKIDIFNKSHAQQIMNFQVQMAFQTQNLKLDSKLVLDSVSYLYDHPQYGFFILKFYQNRPIGSLLLTFENQQSWWMESVYIQQKYRKQGHFKSLFNKAIQIGKQRGCHSIQLYTQVQNQKAKQTYRKLGMYQNGLKFYTYDFIYGKSQTQLCHIVEKSSCYSIIPKQDQFEQQELQFQIILSKQGKNINKKLNILIQEKIVGKITYFTQFSDWRFGLVYYIDHFEVKPQIKDNKSQLKKIHLELTKYFKKSCELNIGALRYLFRPHHKIIVELIQGGQIQHYDVMEIKF